MSNPIRIMKAVGAVLAAASFAAGTVSRAEPVDMARMSCADFIAVEADEQVFVLAWFSGFINGIAGNTRIDPAELLTQVGKLRSFCAANAALPVLQALPRTVAGADAPAALPTVTPGLPPGLAPVQPGLPPGLAPVQPGVPRKPTPQ